MRNLARRYDFISNPVLGYAASTALIMILEAWIHYFLNISEFWRLVITSLGLALVFLLFLHFYTKSRKERHDHLADRDSIFLGRNFEVELVTTEDLRREVRDVSIEIFPDATPSPDITEALREDSAQRILNGRLAEDDVTPHDVLPQAENRKSKFIYVTGVGVTNPQLGRSGAVKSRLAVLSLFELLLHKFVTDNRMKRQIIFATHPYRNKPASENLINRLQSRGVFRDDAELRSEGIVDMYDKKVKVYSITVNKRELEDIYFRVMKETLGIRGFS